MFWCHLPLTFIFGAFYNGGVVKTSFLFTLPHPTLALQGHGLFLLAPITKHNKV
jgi:hypothetical protein